MDVHKSSVRASVDVQRKGNTVELALELPQDFMRLGVDTQEMAGERQLDAENMVIMDAIRHVEFTKATVRQLTEQKWQNILRSLERLKLLPSVLDLLTSLLRFKGLWAVMDVGHFQFLVVMATKHEKVVGCYLQTILHRWITILRPVEHLDLTLDPKSVEALAGLWPRSNSRDRERVDKLFARPDFFPSVQAPESRAALRQQLHLLDGRVLSFSTLLTELRLLRQVATCKPPPTSVERSTEPDAFNSTYWKEWAARFTVLCHRMRRESNDSKAGHKKARNIYQLQEVFFTSCRLCHDTTQRRGIWRFQGDLTPFFAAPATQSPDLPDSQDLPLQGLMYDFLRCFFRPGTSEEAPDFHATT